MSVNRSPEEARNEKLRAMGSVLGALHDDLYVQLVWLHLKWQQYRELFADSPERIELLNQAAPAFFGDLQRILWEDVLLHLARITDKTGSKGQQNLTIARLLREVKNTELESEVERLTEACLSSSNFARDWRNRRLAHRQHLDTAGTPPRPLAPATREAVEEALTTLRALMNAIELHYTEGTVAYEHAIPALGGVDSLVHVLRRGMDAPPNP